MLTVADYVIVAIISTSALLSVLRGFVREAISLLAWISAFMVTGNFYQDLAKKLTYFNDDIVRSVLAIIILFIVTLLVVGTCGNIIRSLLKKAGLSGTDRLLGIAFGIVRGILIVCALLASMQILYKLHILTFIKQELWYSQSVLIPELMRIVSWFFNYLGAS